MKRLSQSISCNYGGVPGFANERQPHGITIKHMLQWRAIQASRAVQSISEARAANVMFSADIPFQLWNRHNAFSSSN